MNELRYALRSLRSAPGFAAVAVLLLALGIGANTAIFSALYGVVLRSLPYPAADRLAIVYEYVPNMPDPPGNRINVARANFDHWRARARSFSALEAWVKLGATESDGSLRERRNLLHVTPGLLALLDARPVRGRLFRDDENQPGRDTVAILSESFWEKRYGRAADTVGRTITLDGTGYTIVGILPESFRLPPTYQGTETHEGDVWLPLSRRYARTRPGEENQRWLLVAGRLAPGVTLASARREMDAIAQQREKDAPEVNTSWRINVQSMEDESRSPEAASALWILSGAVGFVLLIACANLASVLLARALRRKRDLAVRIALGASRLDIVRQLLAECLVLALAGGGLGVLLARWLLEWVRKSYSDLPRQDALRLHPEVFAYTLGLSLVCALLFGILPALLATRGDVHADLKSGGRGTSGGGHRTSRILVAAEVALALMLATGAGLMLKSFWMISTMDQGYQPERILGFDIDLNEQRYKTEDARSAFHRQLIEKLEALPGVARAAVSDNLPLHRISANNVIVEGQPKPAPDKMPILDYAAVSPGYFSAMGMRLVAGRLFTEQDMLRDNRVKEGNALVNEAAAKKLWNRLDVIGRRIRSGDEKQSYTIVGVVADNHQFGPESAPRAQIYYPYANFANAIVVVRAAGRPDLLTSAVQRAAQSLDSDLNLHDMRTMSQRLDEFLVARRAQTTILTGFALLAVLLAAIGIYGVLAQVLAARTQEIGIRMALGAQRRDVVLLMLRQGFGAVGAGLAAGLAGALALGKVIESMLFRVAGRDPATLLVLTLLVLAVAGMATFLPARRATRIDPTVALREE